MDRDRAIQATIGSNFHPSITVNNQTYRGDYTDATYLFKAICSTMLHRPEECKQLDALAKNDVEFSTEGWKAEEYMKFMSEDIMKEKAYFEAR